MAERVGTKGLLVVALECDGPGWDDGAADLPAVSDILCRLTSYCR
jgi:hypothetical protein